jgi:hypothetical protein
MKRTRTKAVGLGLALLAGQLRAAGADNGVSAGPPALLPQNVRTGPWTAAPTADTNLIWLPSRKPIPPGSPPIATTPAPLAIPLVPLVAPVEAGEVVSPGPRAASGTAAPGTIPTPPPVPESRAEPGPLPTLPVPSALVLPAVPTVSEPSVPGAQALGSPMPDWQPVPQAQPPAEWTVALDPQAPAPAPRPAGSQPLPLPRSVGDDYIPRTAPSPDVWGVPGPHLPPGGLPPAPPELMQAHTMVAPGKHGTFGSPPIRLSRDYPPLVDLICGGWLTEQDWTADDRPATDRFYVQPELLLWWTRSAQIPVLATTSTATQTNAALRQGFGFLGDPFTRNLIGPGSLGDTFRPGFRIRAGAWADDCGTVGIDGSFFFLGRRSGATTISSAQTPVITRPFFAPNPEVAGEFGEAVALPGSSVGTLSVANHSSLWGMDANLRRALCRQCDFRAEVFAGYRFLSLNEGLGITESIVAVPGNPFQAPGTLSLVQDNFETRNRFNGGQLGAVAERQWGRFSVALRTSVALGVTHQELDITGAQLVMPPGQPATTFTGGLLAAGPNLGRFSRDRFGVVPEVGINFGYWLTPYLKAYAGYNFLYWSNVIRPGDQIDRVVDLTFVPNTPMMNPPTFSGQFRPQPLFRQTDFWAQGIQFGLETRW